MHPLNQSNARLVRIAAAAIAAAALVGCGTSPKDETAAWSNEKLYAEAKSEADSGNFDRATKLYEKLEGRATGTLLSQQAEIDRAYALWRGNEKAQALSTLERFIKLHPTSPAIDYALYLQGVINFNDNLGLFSKLTNQDLAERDQQASRDAFQSFKQLVDQYPRSRYAEDAQVRMNYIVNALASYEVHVARYYFRRGAYVAAANRAQQAVTEFQTSPSAEEALFILGRSYDRMGLVQLRDDTQRVLKSSFPNSTFLGEDSNSPVAKRKWWQVW